MFKRPLAIAVLLLAAVLGWILFAGVLLRYWASARSSQRYYNTLAIVQQVQTLSQLVTVKYVMEKVVILEDPPQNPVRKLLPDDTRVILVAHGIVKAGVDLAEIKSDDVQVSGNKIVIKLPPPQITDAYLDEKQTQIIEHNTSFLRDFNKDLEQTARQNAVDDIRRAARSSGILKDADDRARAQLRNLFNTLGFGTVEFR
jgi:hypothetical protein